MNSKEKLKIEIDNLNEENVQLVYNFIKKIKRWSRLEKSKEGIDSLSKAKFKKALKQVADVEPDERDK